MTHPSNHSRFGSLLDRNPLGTGHRSTSNGRRMVGDPLRKSLGDRFMTWSKGKEVKNSLREILDISYLGLLATSRVGLLTLGEALRRTLLLKIPLDSLDRRCRCPNPPGKCLSPLEFLDDPMIAVGFDPTRQGRVARRQK